MRHPIVLSILVVVAISVALAVPLGLAAHAASPRLPTGVHPNGGSGGSTSPRCGSANEWFVVPNPQASGMNSTFYGVSADSANDVWAVGSKIDPTNGVTTTLIEQYNGTAWTVVPSPNVPGSNYNPLSSVVALASNDVWAVGSTNISGNYQTLIEQYNGTAWTIVTSPNVAGVFNFLGGVAADGPNDVWTVGHTMDVTGSGAETPLAEHWDGSAWSLVTPPAIGPTSVLLKASVVAGQVFAAGYYTDLTSGINHTLVDHYVPGSGWSVMYTQDAGTNSSQLDASTALAASNVWVAGFSQNADGTTSALFERWNGTSWSVYPSPTNPSPTINGLSAIPATAYVWAVGQSITNPSTGATDTLTEQWQGSEWQDAASATPAGTASWLNDVATVSLTNAWAVGVSNDLTTGTFQTLIEHYAGPPRQTFCQ